MASTILDGVEQLRITCDCMRNNCPGVIKPTESEHWLESYAGYEADLRKLTSAQQMWRQLEPDARGRSGVTAQRLSQLAHPSPLTPHKSASPLSSQSPPQHDILLGNKED
ncbi:hypothetical protein C343_02421 [Cryptococcus neoformans C23]|uniref:Uncharacterized protein n=2 Tax=Cryptococcus neoformans TaxID=5207 RepID=J9VRK3_CRYN9|nr:hypothetical protein CNAG_07809 [Cryptococcus neoformans var. grubii H99]AUB23990.1 hypothetical protein CKF44_07809 [Cryptococcus neoformans var. grubii]OWZ45559.1 hypothetical protein C343_02421 [Cryptococcus neoformans var. grubii C23]OXG36261.1 hypothetical protein C360_02873 [Cryptococcus neoformans var. grubii Bt15]OXG43263.1 hypothetical protein C359_01660 [Cryptococcus neoformans var. grubii Bt120]OXG84120.1 hypothetical protein C350_02238 [Cryptococcus neoformans var. grubii MW-RSA|eukprot:XP_012048873.1 hypothetical protein CNAG_07809 [Cryptococcus neoformans var. grubii H99]